MTEITIEKSSPAAEERQEIEVEKNKSNLSKVRPIKKEPAQPVPEKHGCAHHFGYLSQRTTKEKIPEECMTCGNIVQCMLKNVTG